MTPPISIKDLIYGPDTTAKSDATARPAYQPQQTGGPVSIYEAIGDPSPFEALGNRFQNLWKLYKVSTGMGSAEDVVEVGRAAITAEGTAPGAFRKIGRDLINTLAYYGKKPKDPDEPESPTLSQILSGITAEGLIAGVPDVFTGLVSKPIESILGVGLDRDTLYGMTPEERAQAIKDSAANIALFAVGGAAGGALTRATARAGMATIDASKGVQGALQAGRQAVQGSTKRVLARGVVEGAAGGAAQAAISRFGEDDMGANVFINGILFAPLGVAVEVGRMAMPGSRAVTTGKLDIAGRRIAEHAADVAMTRQLQIGMKDSMSDILFKLDALENHNSLAEALVAGKIASHPDKPVIVPGVSGEALPKIMSVIASGETKHIPQFYQRPDGMFDMLIAPRGKYSPTAIRSFRETGILPNQLVDVDGTTYRFGSLSKDGKKVHLINNDTGRRATHNRNEMRVRTDLETHDVSPRQIIDGIWNDFRAYVLADAEGQPAPQPTNPHASPTSQIPQPPELLQAPSFFERVKSGVGRFLRDETGTLRMTGTDEELLFSRVERSIEIAPFAKGTGQQWKAHLAKSSAQFERDWTGLDTFLEENKDRVLTREEVTSKFGENQIEVQEIVRGGTKYDEAKLDWHAVNEEVELFRSANSSGGYYGYFDEESLSPEKKTQWFALQAKQQKLAQKLENAGHPTKYGALEYGEPGGTNYREIILTLGGNKGIDPKLLEQYPSAFAFEHGHWPHPNVLVWTRARDYVLPNGEKVLYIDEIQSDWFQRMNEYGVRPPFDLAQVNDITSKLTEKRKLFDELAERREKIYNELDEMAMKLNERKPPEGKYYPEYTPQEQARYDQLQREFQSNQDAYYRVEGEMDLLDEQLRTLTRNKGRQVPDAPFKKTQDWVGLILKRILAEAAHGGYDRVAFTNSVRQLARWGTDKYQWKTNALGGRSLFFTNSVLDPADDIVTSMYSWDPIGRRIESLEDVRQAVESVGSTHSKAKLDKLAEQIWTEMQKGGEGGVTPRFAGMKGFYEGILPNTLKDYAKKLGVKVELESIHIPELSFNSNVRGRVDLNPEVDKVMSMRVPEELRTQIKRTKQPLGAASPALVAGLAGAGVGGTIGLATGDTPQERERNALMFGAAAGLMALGGARKLSRYNPPKAPPAKPFVDATPRQSFQQLLDDFANKRAYSQQERAVLEREFSERILRETMESMPPEEQAVINRLNRDVEETVLKPGGSRLEQAQIAAKVSAAEVVRKANSNGMYVDEGLGGTIVLRDFVSDKVVGRFNKTTDALDFINKSGQADGIDLDGGNSNVLPTKIASGLIPIDQGPNPYGDVPYAARPGGEINDLLNTVFDWATPNRNILIALDNKFGTKFFPHYDKTQVKRLEADAAIKPWYEQLSKIDKIVVKMSKAEREEVRAYLETESAAEISARLNEVEVRLGESFAASNIDLGLVQKYLREVERLSSEVDAGTLSPADATRMTHEAANGFNMDQNHLDAAQVIRNVRVGQDAFFGHIAKLTDAILNKTESRAEYAISHKLNGKQLQAAHLLEDLHRNLDRSFGVPDNYRLQDLMAHSRLYFEGDIESALRDFNMPPAVKDLYVSAARIGEISAHEKDPVRSLQRYIKAGFDSRIMLPALKEARQALAEELTKLPADAKWKTERLVERYLNDVQGIPAEASKFTQVAVDDFTRHLGLNVPINVREDVINLILATGEASMQGFRVVAGIRDFVQGVIWYYSRFGADRTLKLLKYGTKGLEGITKADLQRAGIVPDLDVLFFTTPTEFTGTNLGRASNVVGRTLRNISHKGLKISGQKDVYSMLHAGAYLDTWKKVGDTLTRLGRGEIDKAKAYKDLLIDTYELPTISEFDRLVREQKPDEAARLLARETAREQVGTFGSGNNPGGWHRNLGRIAGQYGTWSMWFRAQLGRTLARGTYGQRGAAMLRLAAGQAAIAGVSATLGLNLANWYAPTGAIFTGGPLVDLAVTLAEAISGHGYAQEVALARAKRYLPYDPWSDEFNIGQIYMPGSYFIKDVVEGFQMMQEGDSRFPARMLGVRPKE